MNASSRSLKTDLRYMGCHTENIVLLVVISNCAEIHPMLTAKKPAGEKPNRRAGGTVASSSKSSKSSGSKSQKVDARPKHKTVEMLKENSI